VAVDAAGDVYSSNFTNSSITEYAPGASGNASPIRTIQGANTDLDKPDDMALTPSGVLYVGNSYVSSVVEFAPNASGNATPVRVIGGPLTGLTGTNPGDIDGVGVDSTGNVYVDNFEGTIYTNSIQVFAPTANGNVAPNRRISGPMTGLIAPDDVHLGLGGQLYVTNGESGSFEEFAATASGNAAPQRMIAGSNTGLNQADDFGLDVFGKAYISVPNGPNPTVVEFGPAQSGNATPTATIAGNVTTLQEPEGVAIAPPTTRTLVTSVLPVIGLGGHTHDTATLYAFNNPTGTLTFKLFGPNNPNCAGSPIFTSPSVAVNGNATYVSANFAPPVTGTYRWRASYSGDANNAPAVGSCSDTAEIVHVVAPTLGVDGRAKQSGQTITYSWRVVRGPRPHGFTLYDRLSSGSVTIVNTHLIPSHTKKKYSYVAKNVNREVQSFYVKAKNSSGSPEFGPFAVTN
jgi:hypothetical protein